MQKVYFIFIASLCFAVAHAQLPEQDCISAIPVCQDTYFQPISYVGDGDASELTSGLNTSCLIGGEQNSVWYIFTVTGAGVLEMQIAPNAPGDDYDWAIYDLTNNDCSGILNGTAPEVRCNYSAIPGSTGMSFPYLGVSVPASGPNQCQPMTVLIDETYVLIINNHANSFTGYTLQFGGTAVIYDTLPPSPVSLDPFDCVAPDVLHLTVSEPILCSSLAANGSDFYVAGPSAVNVIGASSTNCTAGNFTTEIDIQLAAPITVNGDYVLHFKIDNTYGNILLDNCGNELSYLDSVAFKVAIADAEFTYTIVKTCTGDSVYFNDFSVGDTLNSWLWDFGNGNTSTSSDPSQFYPATGSYLVTLTISDTGGCSDNDALLVSTYTEPPVALFTVSPGPYCAGIPIQFTNSSTGQALFYEWFFDNGYTNIEDPEFTFTAGGSFDVTLIVTDSIGCKDTFVVNLDISPGLEADFSINPLALCVGDPVTFSDQSLGVPSSYLWSGGGINGDTSTSVEITYNSPGVYYITLIIDNPYCEPDTVTKTISVHEYPIVNLGPDTAICIDETIMLDAANPIYYHLWHTGEETQTITVSVVPQLAWVLVEDSGCVSRDTVFVDSQCPFFIPNAFTPNGDGINDLFKVITDGNQNFTFLIFNRWGQMVFLTTDPNEGWDGTFEGREEEMGVYVYQLTTQFTNGVRRVREGNITLIR